MPGKCKIVVTGAFGYSGRRIAERLSADGHRLLTLTNRPEAARPVGAMIDAAPYHFDRPELLVKSLRGADVLINNYWVRFNHKHFTHEAAVRNSQTLFRAARDAGIPRIVHISITNPSLDSPFEYFRGKARVEAALRETGISHAILRPAVLFGGEDILINNIAWLIRRIPIFGVFGDGQYRLRPIHVDDLATLAVRRAFESQTEITDAAGPDRLSYLEMVRAIARAMGVRRPIVKLPPGIGYAIGRAAGVFLRDTVITREEIGGLMANLLDSTAPAAGEIRFTDWLQQHANQLGIRYHSELARR